MNVTLNGQNLGPILAGNPVISDQLESLCRTLEFSVYDTDSLDNKLGQTVELWYDGERWFIGQLRKRGRKHDGVITYLVYDPMIFFNKNVDDFYFPGQTATQTIRQLAEASAVRVYKLGNTKAVLPPLYYQGAEADKVAVDQLVRTYQANKKKYWMRYNPGYDTEGVDLFERAIPKKLWSFQVGINLTSATIEESIEETITAVKLVNRDTGKVVEKVDDVKLKAYGKAVHFEEIDKDQADTMESKATELLSSLSNLAISQQIEGVNPDNTMPQLYSGDFIYVEEKHTGMMGGYHIRNITHTFMNDNLITISADIENDPYVPEVQFEDATENPATKEEAGEDGYSQEYGTEISGVMDQYGLNGETDNANSNSSTADDVRQQREEQLASLHNYQQPRDVLTPEQQAGMDEYKRQRQAELNGGSTTPRDQLTPEQQAAMDDYKKYLQDQINKQ
jgi:hypothetical protein